MLSVRTKSDSKEARRLHDEVLRQHNLLLQIEVAREESDFYRYRYLATEGFLPGYNFPALPVRAWVPRGEGEYIARPRALAIRALAPHNVVYHEGAKWQVGWFQLPPGDLAQRQTKPKLCEECGAFADSGADRCPVCDALFNGTNSEVLSLLTLPNVRLSHRQRITSNEEERSRRGYEIQVAFSLGGGESRARLVEADVLVGSLPKLRLTYAPAASLLHINRGWQGRLGGFKVDLASGELVTDGEMEGRAKKNQKFGPPRRTGELERLALCVQETQNALLVHGVNAAFADGKGTEASLEYALKRGIEQAFQLEEGLGVERVGRGERRALLFYEAAEGGLGVLRRLAEEHDAVATVAREALRICHFSEDGRDLKPDCVQACYECLLSYANQSDAFPLDRQLVRDMLLGLAQCRVEPRSRGVSHQEHLESLRSRTQSAFERLFLNTLAEGGYRLPDDAQRSFQEPRCIVDFFYEPNVVVFCDGPPHDKPDQQRVDDAIRRELRSRGYRVVVVRHESPIEQQIDSFPEVFRRGP